MNTDPIGPFPLAGTTIESWLLKFDKRGQCTSPKTHEALLKRCKSVNRRVVLFSHGWNNEFRDAGGLYTRFLAHLETHLKELPPPFEPPIFVGVVWPSTWLSFDHGPDIASDSGAAVASSEQELARELSAQLPRGAKQQRLLELMGRRQLDRDEGEELAALTAEALHQELAGGTEDGDERAIPDATDLLRGAEELERATPSTPLRDELEETGDIGDAPSSSPADQLTSAGLLSFLDPRKLLRVASVYQMKDRAGTVGANGVSVLLAKLLDAAPGRVHAVGHSFGGKVVLSAIAALPARAPRVASVLLLQPAVSHWCFAVRGPGGRGQGGYREVPSRVAQSIVATYSAHDFALHSLFHRVVRRVGDEGEIRIAPSGPTQAGNPPNGYAALGGYGPRGAGEELREPLPEPGTPVALDTVAYGATGTALIGYDGTMHKRVAGHGDVATPYTSWLLYSQMLAARG